MAVKAKKERVKPSKKMGRPTGYSKKLVDDICESIVEGKTIRTIAKEKNFAVSSFFKWLGEHEYFSEQYAIAKDLQSDIFVEDILDIADSKNPDVARDKLRVDTRKWIASKLKPYKYGEKYIAPEPEKKTGIEDLTDEMISDRIKVIVTK